MLILHSRTDTKVPVVDALDLARELERRGKAYELVIYDRDGHSLPVHRTDRNRRIVAWFRDHSTLGE